MGTNYATGREPTLLARYTVKGSGAMSVFHTGKRGVAASNYDYYPNGYICPYLNWEATFFTPGGGGGFTLFVAVGETFPHPADDAPIPVNLYLTAGINSPRVSGTKYLYTPPFGVTDPNLKIPLLVAAAPGFYPFTVEGYVEVWADCVEYISTTTDGACGVFAKAGGKVGLSGVLNGYGFAVELQAPGPQLAGTGVTVQSTLRADAQTTGSYPKIAPGTTGYDFRGAPAASAEMTALMWVRGDKGFRQEYLRGVNYTVGLGGERADVRQGVLASVPARGAPYYGDTNVFEGYSALAKLSGNMSSSYRVKGVVKAVQDPYPDPLKVTLATQNTYFPQKHLTVGGGELDSGVVERRSFQESLQTRTKDNAHGTNGGITTLADGPISLSVDRQSLADLGEYPTDTGMYLHGDSWSALVVTQEKVLPIDGGNSLSGDGGTYRGNWDPLPALSDATGDANRATVSAVDVIPPLPDPGAPPPDPADTGDGLPAPLRAIRVVVPKKYTPTAPPAGQTVLPSPRRREWGTRRNLAGNPWLSGYRYLSVRVRSIDQDRRPFTLRIGKKLWWGATGTADTWVTVEFDLCDESATVDGKPLPLVSTRSSIRWADDYNKGVFPGAEAPYFGVNQATALDFIGFSPGGVYEFAGVKLFRKSTPTLSFLSPFQSQRTTGTEASLTNVWGKEWVASAGTLSGAPTFFRRNIVGDTDGRMSLEEASQGYFINGVARVAFFPLLADTLSFINGGNIVLPNPPIFQGVPAGRNPGWKAISLCDPVTTGAALAASTRKGDTLSTTYSAVGLWGGGVFWRNGSQAVVGVDIPMTEDDSGRASLIVPAQVLYTSFDFWPAAGDIFGFGRTGGERAPIENKVTVELRASKVLRGHARNLIVGAGAAVDADSAEGITDAAETDENRVRLKEQASRKSGGTGTGDPVGRYETRLPGAKMTAGTVFPAIGSPSPRQMLYDVTLDGAVFGATGAAAKADSADDTPQAKGLLFLSAERKRVAFRSPGRAGVSVISDRTTGYYAKAEAGRTLTFQKATVPVPDFLPSSPGASVQWESPVTVRVPPQDTGEVYRHPSLAQFSDGSLRLRWERQKPPAADAPAGTPWSRGVWESVSTSDGESWSSPVLIMANARNPVWFRGNNTDSGSLLSVHVLPDADAPTTGFLSAQRFDAGGVSGTRFNMRRLLADGTLEPMKIRLGAGYDGVQSNDTSGRWLMTLTVPGEDATSDWQSSDDGATWARLPSSL